MFGDIRFVYVNGVKRLGRMGGKPLVNMEKLLNLHRILSLGLYAAAHKFVISPVRW